MKFVLLFLLLTFSLFAKVDLNHAGLKELTLIKGVGVKTAQNILGYRKTYGCFKSVDEFMKIKGIGKKTLEKNKANLEVKQCKKK